MTALEQRLGAALRAGVEMRIAQARYFRLRPGPEKIDALRAAKSAETRFDSLARQAIREFYSAEETGR